MVRDGRIEPIDLGELDDLALGLGCSAYVDHDFSPYVLCHWAEKNGYHVHDLALELILGRWVLNHHADGVLPGGLARFK